MKISFNPSNSNKNILDLIKNNKDIIFDLKGHSIFARGVEFKGSDTNTWRDIEINNVSIGSHTLDLQNGSNTTLTNINGVVTINSTWRPVVDNLTSDSTTSSLSAKQGKVLKALIDGKSNSDHNHDGRYVRYYAVTALDCNNLAVGLTVARISATNAAHINNSAYLYISDVGTPFQIQIPDSSAPYIYKRYYGPGKWSEWFKLNAGYADSAGNADTVDGEHASAFSHKSWWHWSGQGGQPTWLWGGNSENDYYVYNPSNFNVNTAQYLRNLGNKDCQTGRTQAYGDVYSYNTYTGNTGSPTEYSSVIGFGRGSAGTVEIAGGWCNTHLYWRSLRDCYEDWFSWRTVLDSSNYTEFINNYYWANVKISASSSTTTSPTFSNVYLGNSLYLNNMGSNLIYNGPNDSANGVGGSLSNLVFSSWYGVSFTTSYTGSTYANKNAVSINCRTGQLYAREVQANGFRHTGHNNNDAVLLAGGDYKILSSIWGGDSTHFVFLGYLTLRNGSDGTISDSFMCLGKSVPFTYIRGGAYCRINIPNTSSQTFYIKAAIASVHYSGAGMGNQVGNHRGDGAWWLHCDAVGSNAVQVQGFHLANGNNDSWWGGNPLYPGDGAAKIITVCLFGYVLFR